MRSQDDTCAHPYVQPAVWGNVISHCLLSLRSKNLNKIYILLGGKKRRKQPIYFRQKIVSVIPHVRVSYCCITNYPKLNDLKQQAFRVYIGHLGGSSSLSWAHTCWVWVGQVVLLIQAGPSHGRRQASDRMRCFDSFPTMISHSPAGKLWLVHMRVRVPRERVKTDRPP